MSNMPRRDAWSNPSLVSREDAQRMAAFLEDRARCPDQRQVNDWLIAALDPRPGECILEAGSGSGVMARMIAPRVAPGGVVVGMDVSHDMAFAAQEYLAADPAGAVEFVIASAEVMPFPDGAFDAAFAARLLLHVPDAAAVLRQLVRVTRPRGRVAVMDLDFETLAIDHPDRELTRRIIAWRTDHHSGDNWSGRQLYRRMVEAGLRDVTVLPITTMATDDQAGLTGSVFRAAEVVRDGGAITPMEHDAWTAVLRERLDAGTFMAAATYFIVSGTRK
jgi:ubiquinone/menaquinone biosynthesis C-methylase UbiE